MIEVMEKPSWVCPAGRIIGWHKNGVDRATCIRYAHASRYGIPVAEPSQEGVIDATAWAPACPQPRVEWLEQIFTMPKRVAYDHGDENCQHLSVTVPAGVSLGDELPVMVWFHGGKYTTGAGDEAMYEPAALVREQHVIVVTVTYRLGLFGYLGSGEGTPANLGLLDQIEALRWVNRNIESFGGNPKNVTIFGQSAGGDAVAHLMISRGTKGLFHRAIIQSAPFGLMKGRADMNATMFEEASRIASDATVDEIVAAQSNVEAQAKRYGLKSSMPFGVQYGLDPLPDESEVDESWRKAASRIEVLVGSTDREVAMYKPAIPALRKIDSLPFVGRIALSIVVNVLTKKIFGAGVTEFAKRHRQGGGRGYQYVLSWGPKGNEFAGAHTIELPLLFGDRAVWEATPLVAGADWEEIHRHGQTIRKIWASFARNGQVDVTDVPNLIKLKRI